MMETKEIRRRKKGSIQKEQLVIKKVAKSGDGLIVRFFVDGEDSIERHKCMVLRLQGEPFIATEVVYSLSLAMLAAQTDLRIQKDMGVEQENFLMSRCLGILLAQLDNSILLEFIQNRRRLRWLAENVHGSNFSDYRRIVLGRFFNYDARGGRKGGDCTVPTNGRSDGSLDGQEESEVAREH